MVKDEKRPRAVEVISRKRVLDGFIKVDDVQVRVERFDGGMSGPIDRMSVERGDAVAVVLHDPIRDELLFANQFRYSTLGFGDGWLMEIVAGMIDPGETPEEAARRETEEETGLTADMLTPICAFYSSPGGLSERVHLFIAEASFDDMSAQSDDGEDLELIATPVADAAAKLAAGGFDDAKTIIGLQYFFRARRAMEKTSKDTIECFVIMPFGEKSGKDEKPIDYNRVYSDLIKPAVEACNLTPVRCDEIPGAGGIVEKMIKAIHQAEVAIVDISFANPNVFYELGVRHALSPSVTVLIKNKDYHPPFNITTQTAIDYTVDGDEIDAVAKRKITEFIKFGCESPVPDSPVFSILNHRVRDDAKAVTPNERRTYAWAHDPAVSIELLGGELRNVRGYDVWVNSENTHMEMARHYDRAISSAIRYLGAKRDRYGRVQEDVVYNDLKARHEEEFGEFGEVPGTHCLESIPGELAELGVQRVLHVASVRGVPGRNYEPVKPLEDCVWNALRAVEHLELEPPATSILLPFFGTGVGLLSLRKTAQLFLGTALHFLRNAETSPIKKVGFITLTETDFRVCQPIFAKHPALEAAP